MTFRSDVINPKMCKASNLSSQSTVAFSFIREALGLEF